VRAQDDTAGCGATATRASSPRRARCFPSEGPEALPALGNAHLLPYGVQEGQAFLRTPAGEAIIGTIRERSTAALTEVVVRSGERPAPPRRRSSPPRPAPPPPVARACASPPTCPPAS
jgi:hypothetical protein